MSRKSSKTARTTEGDKPERYVRWRNDGPRAHERIEFDEDIVVEDWVCLRTISLPERFADKCEALGLTRLGYARP